MNRVEQRQFIQENTNLSQSKRLTSCGCCFVVLGIGLVVIGVLAARTRQFDNFFGVQSTPRQNQAGVILSSLGAILIAFGFVFILISVMINSDKGNSQDPGVLNGPVASGVYGQPATICAHGLQRNNNSLLANSRESQLPPSYHQCCPVSQPLFLLQDGQSDLKKCEKDELPPYSTVVIHQ